MLTPMASAADPQFNLDRERSDQEKQRRVRHFHVFEVPLLRVIGFSMITVLVLLRYGFVPDGPSTDAASPWAVGAVGFTYSLVSWLILYLFFDALKPRLNLGTVFLGVDVFFFILAVYL